MSSYSGENVGLAWAFQYVEDRYLDIVEQEKTVRRKREAGGFMPKRLALTAACILCLLLILALPVAAIAANWFGLRDLLLPRLPGGSAGTEGNRVLSGEDMDSGADQASPGQDEGNAPEADGQAAISLAGYQGSPEWQALAEWREFLEGYDGDREMHQAAGERLDASFARYSCYMVHSREMAEKMDEIAGKYGLKLHTASYDLQEHPELMASCGDFLGEGTGYGGYMYEDGTFQIEGSMETAGGMWDFRLLRSVRGTFHDAMLDIGDVADYQECCYKTSRGASVTLALGPDKAFILAGLEDCFVTVSVYSIIQPVPAGADDGLTLADLKDLADGFGFAALSPVSAPGTAGGVPGAEDVGGMGGVPGAEDVGGIGDMSGVENAEARKLYAATLRNLLYSRILPDGSVYKDLPMHENSKFAVYDVDGDGGEELVLCYDSGFMAGMWGFVLGYDGDSKEIHIQLEEQFDLVFLKNGNLKVLDSHNQTDGDMWPYSLYRYLPESDAYELAGHVHAEDEDWSRDYPEHVDVSGAGTVYSREQ